MKEHWILDVRGVRLEAPARVLGIESFGRVLAGMLNGSAVSERRLQREAAWYDQETSMTVLESTRSSTSSRSSDASAIQALSFSRAL
jgi:hypothetical protein